MGVYCSRTRFRSQFWSKFWSRLQSKFWRKFLVQVPEPVPEQVLGQVPRGAGAAWRGLKFIPYIWRGLPQFRCMVTPARFENKRADKQKNARVNQYLDQCYGFSGCASCYKAVSSLVVTRTVSVCDPRCYRQSKMGLVSHAFVTLNFSCSLSKDDSKIRWGAER